ncbi:SusC/RagA family TonB-linked outer membrane protein [Winogradskyella sp.]|uniref:SusC/RagA family TonB-linked outer membrane protein n=1 Tax=Winogradskyella sp. TaxID=1883156 RepID=UPI00260D4D8D|nr:SusC/RagA family TonB-linked outer membrane protein [Winogradskyella sp.]
MKTFLNAVLICIIMLPATMFAQTLVSGTVTDKADAMPLPGVNIVIKGTSRGASTDFDGKYSIEVNQGETIVVSYVGYSTQEIIYNGEATIDVALEEDAAQLDEVVLVGYGTTTVKDATGSVESVTSKDFTRGNIVTAENLISGRVAGVNVSTAGGQPGATGAIRIRGGSSINASNDPLIVIDGLPISNQSVAGANGVLATINPNDIESFSVLKDASATAIYGSRAANGVIIIKTKKGRTGFSADLDTQYTFGQVDETIDVLSADQYRDLINSQPLNGTTFDTSQLGEANTDWQDEILRETVSAIHNVTLRGELFKFLPTRFSFGVTRQEGALITSLYERRTLSLSLNPSFFDDHLKVNVNANMAFEDNRFADRNQVGAALSFDPTQPVLDPDAPAFTQGFFQYLNSSGTDFAAQVNRNPVFKLTQRRDIGDANRTFGNINLDYKFHFLPELKAVLNLGYDRIESVSTINELLATDDDVKRDVRRTEETRTNESLDTYLTYAKDIGDFGFDVTAGYSYQRFSFDGFETNNIFDPETFPDTFADPDVVLIGFLGRLNLNYKGKYLLTLNYRRDGTSRFSEENRWGDFGGAALAWRISDENFLKDSNTISNLKLRASIGFNGQQELFNENDIFLNRLRLGDENSIFQFNNQPVRTLVPSAINPDLKWEETRTIEFGVDYGLFNNRVSGSISVFQKDSEDLLFNAPVADGTNFTNNIVQNVGNLRTLGLEFSIDYNVINKEDFNWNVNFNATLLDREITELAFGQDIFAGGVDGATGLLGQVLREGEAPNSFLVFKQLYDTNGNAIEGAYADLNGDNIINDEDRYIRENPDPDALLGFQSNLNYKNWDFSFNLRASIGNHVYNNVNSSRAQFDQVINNASLGNLPTSVFDNNFQRRDNVILSDIYVEDASFLRMDNITLGYTFRDFSKYIKSIRLWAGLQNAFVITDYSGVDPEIDITGDAPGIDKAIFPRTRNILVGAQFRF